MPKQKTRKSAAKRFKKTKTGKIIHRRQNISHLKSKKSKSQKKRGKKIKKLQGSHKKKIEKMIAS